MSSTRYLTQFESTYKTLAAELRDQIRSGQLKPGDRLPSFSEGKASGISQRTFEHAHALLEKEGLIRRIPRRGTFVSAPPLTAAVARSSRSSVMQNTVLIIAARRDVGRLQQHLEGWHGTEIVDHLSEFHYNIMFLSLDALIEREFKHLVQDPPAALVFLEASVGLAMGEQVAQILKKIARPVVLAGDDKWMADFDRIAPDHEKGAFELTKRLIEKGGRRILNVWPGDTGRYWLAAKWAGYRAAIQAAGLDILDPVIIPERSFGKIDRQWFDDEVRRFYGYIQPTLVGENPVDAIMSYTDPQVGIIAAAVRLAGLTPNSDVLIAGYDDSFSWGWHEAWEPTKPVLTVNKQDSLIAKLICQRVHEVLQLPERSKPTRILVESKLIELEFSQPR